MNLSDREILELNELCGAVVDGALTEAQRARLAGWLADSEEARRFYVRALGQSASLHTYASEMCAEAPDISVPPQRLARAMRYGVWWGTVLPAAAALVIGLWFSYRPATAQAAPASEGVARLTGAKNSRWSAVALQPGDRIEKNQKLELAAGLAEITFDSGARVVLEGPAALDVNSAWDGTLRQGTLKASVPPEAIGFRISNSAVDVVDLGTEFTMIADGRGAAEVLVLKGEVEAAPRGSDDETILLRENEARRFAASGVSGVSDQEKKFAQFTQPLALDRFAPAISYVHWSFDDASGELLRAEAGGRPLVSSDAHLSSSDAALLAASHVPGRRARALHFGGQLFARANVPGLSGASPRTVAFWVKVPEGAATDAWMVSWGTAMKKLGSRPVQISWNRRPGEGSFGALRTDFGGGYAIGSHDLRDGRWHHVAVYFSAGDETVPMQVRQYVDGRLESSTITHTPGKSGTAPLTGGAAQMDVVWLGCRLTGKQPERFRGELDELFIADRGLEPNEIVSLMNDNRFPASAVATAP